MQKQSPEQNNLTTQIQELPPPQNQQPTSNKFEQYVMLTASLLRDLIDDQQEQQSDETNFDSTILKSIDLKTYIQSIHKQTSFEPECMIIALIYIDRYNLNSPDFTLTWSNIHKLLLACLLLATKFHDEVYYDNKAFQIGGGVNNVKLIELQMKVFETLDFDLFVQDVYFLQFLESLYNAYVPEAASNDDNSIEQSQNDQYK